LPRSVAVLPSQSAPVQRRSPRRSTENLTPRRLSFSDSAAVARAE
jgi:hypothetical protein